MLAMPGRGSGVPLTGGGVPANLPSPALEWLWQHFRDVRRPDVLDCGPLRTVTANILLRRCGKLYIADLVSPVQSNDARLWDRSGKVPVFLVEDFLAPPPNIPPASLAVILCWHLFDLVPKDSLPAVVERLFACLRPGGMLFCLLREPYLPTGADANFWLLDMKTIASDGDGKRAFPYPVLTTSQLEKLFPGGRLKTFLTRSGRREILVLK